jgi:hypothetical protein
MSVYTIKQIVCDYIFNIDSHQIIINPTSTELEISKRIGSYFFGDYYNEKSFYYYNIKVLTLQAYSKYNQFNYTTYKHLVHNYYYYHSIYKIIHTNIFYNKNFKLHKTLVLNILTIAQTISKDSTLSSCLHKILIKNGKING